MKYIEHKMTVGNERPLKNHLIVQIRKQTPWDVHGQKPEVKELVDLNLCNRSQSQT